jgi:hypothetical protein
MKIIITQDTFAPSMDGPVYLPAPSVVELETDAARGVVMAGKGLYVEPKDDPSARGNAPGTRTATEAQVKLARDAMAGARKTAKAPEAATA